MKLNRRKGMDSPERGRRVWAVITTYHLRAPGSSHHQVVSHSIVQRFTDEATAHVLYTHTHTHSSARSHLHTYRQAASCWLDRLVVECTQWPQFISYWPVSIFSENDWTRESNRSWWLDWILSKLVLFLHFSPNPSFLFTFLNMGL